jgi:hypothetical protein
VARKAIVVTYTPTDKMIADGLTKSLPRNKWPGFLAQLGLEKAEHYVTKKAYDPSLLEDQVPEVDASLKGDDLPN